jgi:hypothetical protein
MEHPTEPTEQELRIHKADVDALLERQFGGILRNGGGSKFITWRDVLRLFVTSTNGVKSMVAPVRDRIAGLEKTVEELKAAQTKTLADSFRGTWMAGTVYARGGLVVQDGSLWLALADSAEKPGASSDWKMVTKRGKDGKDLRG